MYSGLLEPFKKYDSVNPMDVSEPTMNLFNQVMAKNETGNRYDALNRDPFHPDAGFNVGAAQWRGGRARNIIDKTYAADPEAAMKFIQDIDLKNDQDIWANREAVTKMLGSPAGIKVQDEQMRKDFKYYMKLASDNGVQGAGAAMVWADLAHRYGAGGARRFLNKETGVTTLEHLMDELNKLEQSGDRNAPINKTRFTRYAQALGGEAGVIASMYKATTDVLEGMDVATAVNGAVVVRDPMEVYREATDTSKDVAKLPDLGTGVASTAVDETAAFREQIFNILRATEPDTAPQNDPASILINAIIKYLIGGV